MSPHGPACPAEMTSSRQIISVVIPVFQEEESIGRTVRHLRALSRTGEIEIIVVDGDSSGSTIRTISDRQVITATSGKGRARQMNRGAELASGNILLFLHADTLLPDDGLVKIEAAMKNDACMAGSFNLGINSSRRIFRITEKYAAFRTRLTGIPFGDQAIFIRKAYFENTGRYRDIPLMEDIELMVRIKKRGGHVVIIPEKVLTSARRWEREGVLYCTFRNWMLQILYLLGVSPERLARFYRSRS